jgi:hypothetical protein
MPALVAGIHVFGPCKQQGLDGRDKPGHDCNFWSRATLICGPNREPLGQRREIMRYLGLIVAGAFLVAAASGANAAQGQPGLAPFSAPAITLIQEKKKETVGQKIKRAWKRWTGYSFCVRCPIPIPLTTSTCTETGKSRADAKAKCQARNQFCYVLDEGCR